MNRYKLLYLFLVSSLGLLFLSGDIISAEDKGGIVFDKDIIYDIYYGLNDFEVTTVKNVKVVGIKDMYGITFLVIKSSRFGPQDKEGYIILKEVRAILPSGLIESKTDFKVEK